MKAEVPLLNCKQLAAALQRKSAGFVTAMKAAGYQFQYGNRTTRAHALKWLKENPTFTMTTYAKVHQSPPADDPGAFARKSGARGRKNGRRIPSPSAHPRPSAVAVSLP